MNKTDRMLAILLELQRKENQRAEDLAALFETSVRTIYRDMQALCEAGVPIIGAPGRGYSLMEGYFLPPVSFTPGESVALLLGTEFIEQRFDADYAGHAERARAKITAVTPSSVREEAAKVRASMKLQPGVRTLVGTGTESDTLKLLRRAILAERKVAFTYRKKSRGPEEEQEMRRMVAPYGLVLVNGAWTLVAQCDLRGEIRHFRLSRMTALELTEEVFSRPADFDLARYSPPDDRHITVVVQADSRVAERVRETGNYYLERMEEDAGGARMVFRVRRPEELLYIVLGWGSGAWVVEPEELRTMVREEIFKMSERY